MSNIVISGIATPSQSTATTCFGHNDSSSVHCYSSSSHYMLIFEELLSDSVLANGIVDVETDSSEDRMEEEAES